MEAHLSTLLFVSTAACFVALSSGEATEKPQFTAMYVFGDSLVDPGNNVYFLATTAKANYKPYGIDFDRGSATGRFSNGKIIVDFVAELSGLPLLPSYANTIAKSADILSGVNYASAGAGILQDTGYALGHLITLSKQIESFKITTLSQLSNRMQEDELSNYLAKALVYFNIGSNDYLNNYFMPQLYASSHIYTSQQFVDLLMKLYTGHIMELHRLGLRKFFLANLAPIGCIPFEVRQGTAPPGECVSSLNAEVQLFNSQLESLVDRLNSDYVGSAFTVGYTYKVLEELRDNANAYGFKEKDKPCCEVGNNILTQVVCPLNSVPCSNRDEYIFWDSAHPTQAVNKIGASRVYNNTLYCSPFTIQQMATM